jgi:hypothetical protein
MVPGAPDPYTSRQDRIHGRFTLMRRSGAMLSTIALILIVLWLLGMVSSYTIGGFIHILLVVAIIVFLMRVIQGRRPVV